MSGRAFRVRWTRTEQPSARRRVWSWLRGRRLVLEPAQYEVQHLINGAWVEVRAEATLRERSVEMRLQAGVPYQFRALQTEAPKWIEVQR